MTSPHTLHWDILRWNFLVEHIDTILRHNVQFRGSLWGLSILVLECSNRDQLEREACQRGWKLGLFRGQTLMKSTEIFMEQAQSPGPLFPPGFTPGKSGAMCYHGKPYGAGQRLLGSVRAWIKHDRMQMGDYSTCKQNASLTSLGFWSCIAIKTQEHKAAKCARMHTRSSSDLIRLSSSKRRQFRSWSFWLWSAVVREESELCGPDGHYQKYREDKTRFADRRQSILFTCRIVTLSHSAALFSPPHRT